MDPYTERRTRAALDALADAIDASPNVSHPVRALAAHLRDTPAGALDEPRAIATELAEAYAAALLATDHHPSARRAISAAIRSAYNAPRVTLPPPCPECGGPADTGAGHDCEA
ncbi:MAG: hypothetical protein MUE61_08280 [Vicinamibacterales bacterium]|jgi:hypothetical protein|nr:hypothetical protein [Vicinamibacterales bacterium]MCU0477163.1 hypothetical protein [Chloroflexota bacterium]